VTAQTACFNSLNPAQMLVKSIPRAMAV